jgi:hypothetical protein
MPEFEFKDAILWRNYDETIALLKEKRRPVFAFVLDESGICWPFLREIFKAMPRNEKLRNVLNGPCIPMLLKADALPEYMKELGTLGAGGGYHIAILDPSGLTPMAKIDYVTGDPDALVEKIARALEAVAPVYS